MARDIDIDWEFIGDLNLWREYWRNPPSPRGPIGPGVTGTFADFMRCRAAGLPYCGYVPPPPPVAPPPPTVTEIPEIVVTPEPEEPDSEAEGDSGCSTSPVAAWWWLAPILVWHRRRTGLATRGTRSASA